MVRRHQQAISQRLPMHVQHTLDDQHSVAMETKNVNLRRSRGKASEFDVRQVDSRQVEAPLSELRKLRKIVMISKFNHRNTHTQKNKHTIE